MSGFAEGVDKVAEFLDIQGSTGSSDSGSDDASLTQIDDDIFSDGNSDGADISDAQKELNVEVDESDESGEGRQVTSDLETAEGTLPRESATGFTTEKVAVEVSADGVEHDELVTSDQPDVSLDAASEVVAAVLQRGEASRGGNNSSSRVPAGVRQLSFLEVGERDASDSVGVSFESDVHKHEQAVSNLDSVDNVADGSLGADEGSTGSVDVDPNGAMLDLESSEKRSWSEMFFGKRREQSKQTGPWNPLRRIFGVPKRPEVREHNLWMQCVAI